MCLHDFFHDTRWEALAGGFLRFGCLPPWSCARTHQPSGAADCAHYPRWRRLRLRLLLWHAVLGGQPTAAELVLKVKPPELVNQRHDG
mmetsp:Transcript_9606/g.13529  ORF Transcript_9606/g.13529 Transcript_9606/m.13529 type:complete len:88 (+) Transcript_9606:347-610(+)